MCTDIAREIEVWFHIGLWDENDQSESMSQLNTQPVMPRRTIGSRRVTYLILEGEKTTPVGEAIMDVLTRHGVK